MELAEARSVLARALEHPEWLFSQPDAAGRRSDAWGASRRAIHSPPRAQGGAEADRASLHAPPHRYRHKYQISDCYITPNPRHDKVVGSAGSSRIFFSPQK